MIEASSTYQKILQDGRAEGVLQGERNLLVLVGTNRFGPPGPEVRRILEMASEIQLRAWAQRLLEAKSWPELVTAA
jgi:hypothetical protein